MTEAAQEHLTGMPTPKQDERTPGRLAESLAQMIIEWVDGSKGGDWKTGLPNIIQRRIDRLDGNAYGSTDALREALHVAEQNFEAIRKVLVNNLVEPERSAFWLAVRARDAARTALAGVTDPQTDIAKR